MKNKIITIEEYINNEAIPFNQQDYVIIKRLSENVSKALNEPTGQASAYELITGFVKAHNLTQFIFKSSGEINASQIRAKAQLDQSTWDSIRNNNPRLLEATIFRICFALELNTEEANALMMASGRAYNPSFPLHVVVFALLDMRIYDYDTVYTLLGFFGQNYGFKNIYKD